MVKKYELEFGFINFNFGTGEAKDQKIIDFFLSSFPYMFFFAGVETKVDDFREMMSTKLWHVRQNMKLLSKRNVAIAWRRGLLANPKADRLRLGVLPRGHKMLTRWIRIFDFDLWTKPGIKKRCRIIVAHRPKKVFRILWPLFDLHTKACIHISSHGRAGRWVLLEDFNEDGHVVAKRFGGTFFGEGIDGAIVGPGMTVHDLNIVRKPKQEKWTDHVGVNGKLKLV